MTIAAWIWVGAAVWCVASVFAGLVIGAAIRVSRMPDPPSSPPSDQDPLHPQGA